MPEPGTQASTRAGYNQAIQHCAQVYHHIRAELKPKDIGYSADCENQQKASLAYIAQLPLLIDPASFQLYIACVAQGVGIGAVDIADAGRLCHIAQTAMSAWKLVNILIPAEARKQEKAARENTTPLPKGNHPADRGSQSQPQQPAQRAKQPPQGEEKATPLPSKGNHSEGEAIPYEDWEDLYAVTKLPDWETQVKLFKSLRERGVGIPTDEELRERPAEALRHCETARYFMKCQPGAPGLDSETGARIPPAAHPPRPEPAKEPVIATGPAHQAPPAQAA